MRESGPSLASACGAVQQQVLPDPENPEHGTLDRAERLTDDGRGLRPVDELRPVRPVVDAVDADLAPAAARTLRDQSDWFPKVSGMTNVSPVSRAPAGVT